MPVKGGDHSRSVLPHAGDRQSFGRGPNRPMNISNVLWQNPIDERRGYLPHFSSLVALRFFAAAAIIFAHTLGALILRVEYLNEWGFPSLMVFFHILSGFTLASIYPKLDSQLDVLRFWVARVGRIWPVHILMIVVIILCFQRDRIFDGVWRYQLFSNVTLTQSWLPIGQVAKAFNGPAWSLSSEFGLYLFFPFLIHKW
jgi:peptidoglycan/LPS O-acetylase OafA/YrhL